MAQRRSSYASVLSGNNASNEPPRSGILAHQLAAAHPHPPSHILPSVTTTTTGNAMSLPPMYNRYDTRYDRLFDQQSLGESYGTSFPAPHEQPRSLHLLPPYLNGSRYADRLAYTKPERKSHTVAKSGRSSAAGSLSTSASNMSLHKMPLSHRGVSHEVVERTASPADDLPPPLPSRLSHTDKFSGMEIADADGLEVKFSGTVKQQDDAAAIRADMPMPKEAGIYYFEVKVEGKSKESTVAVGFSTTRAALNKLPGWESQSWAYHGDDGYSFSQTVNGKPYALMYGSGDVVGCGVDFDSATAFFTKNGVHLGNAFKDLPLDLALYPAVGLKKQGEQVKVNFGQSQFIYDIVAHLKRRRRDVKAAVKAVDIAKVTANPKSSLSKTRDLVAQYLAHEGFIDTTKVFAAQSHRYLSLLAPEQATKIPQYKEDKDAVQRQRIRNAVLEGDIDRAMKDLSVHYPSVLESNENIGFKLKCRKFVEMIRRCTELHPLPHSQGGHPANNGHRRSHSREQGIFEDGMELDSSAVHEDAVDMDLDDGDLYSDLQQGVRLPGTSMRECIEYGQVLKREYKGDPRREVRQVLEDTFALIAYPDAHDSSIASLLKAEGRVAVAEELNSAILVSIGKASVAAFERLCQQTDLLVSDLAAHGRSAALLHVQNDFMR